MLALEPQPLNDPEIRLWYEIDLGRSYDNLLHELIETTPWRQEEIKVYGKPYLQPRLSAWHSNLIYSYSGITLQPEPWSDLLLDIKVRVERLVEHQFNSVLLNYYRDQNDSMGMHCDNESELGDKPVIASLSIGEERTFLFKHKTRRQPVVKLPLPSGSLLEMRGNTQRDWRHGISKQSQPRGPRINLTFRMIFKNL